LKSTATQITIASNWSLASYVQFSLSIAPYRSRQIKLAHIIHCKAASAEKGIDLSASCFRSPAEKAFSFFSALPLLRIKSVGSCFSDNSSDLRRSALPACESRRHIISPGRRPEERACEKSPSPERGERDFMSHMVLKSICVARFAGLMSGGAFEPRAYARGY
jgi:hypothetical protein